MSRLPAEIGFRGDRVGSERPLGEEAMIGEVDRDYLLFDGDCGICNYAVEWIKKRDRKNRFAIEPYQLSSEESLAAVGLDYEKCSRKAWLAARSGRLYGGASAMNYILFRPFPWTILVVMLRILAPLLLIESLGYYLIARNRHR